MDITKSNLAIILSRLKVFEEAKLRLEQYPMDSEVGASLLWNAYMNHDIKNKIIADLGCGTGILGIGCLLLGAAEVFFVDNDTNALKIAKQNIKTLNDKTAKKATFLKKDIKDFNELVDVIVMNPPFGTKQKHADRIFLEHAFKISKVIYSFHKLESENFLRSFSQDNNFTLTQKWSFDFPLKQTMVFHKKRIHRFKVGCFRFEKQLNI